MDCPPDSRQNDIQGCINSDLPNFEAISSDMLENGMTVTKITDEEIKQQRVAR